ncbi:MAG TPA: Flp pilus assembly protein CpaB [Syntrophomonas sp.]|nr:Flp pilus assembly protein CpaB [Syntrophomonas sp.]
MRSKLVFILALIFGLLAAYLTFSYLDQMKKSVDNREYTRIAVAAQDIPANTAITSSMLLMKDFPSEFLNNQVILDINEVVGKVSLTNFNRGEIILAHHMIKSGERKQGLAYAIDTGMRAMSINVDEASGVAGLIKIGDRVDIIAKLNGEEGSMPPSSVVVLQDVEVLAIGSSLADDKKDSKEKTPAKTVTLAVTLENSLRLKTAVEGGKISLILRSPADKGFGSPAPFSVEGFNYFSPPPTGTE